MVRTILKLKNFNSAARIKLPTTSTSFQQFQSSRSLAQSSSNAFHLINKESHVPQENSSSSTTYDRPTVYSDDEVETAGPVVKL